MDSYALNKTNNFLNSLSGNYFPVKSNDHRDRHQSMGTKFYVAFTWTMAIIFSITTSVVLIFLPIEVTVQSNTACLALVIEGMVIAIYINIRLPLLRKLINKMQEILIVNDTLKEAISKTLDPISQPIKIYAICSIFGPTIWNALSFFRLFSQNQFTYTDFKVPAYFPFEPFGRKLFAFGVLIQVVGSFYTVTRKFATDVYVIHIIALLTAQYKYLRNDLANILDHDESCSKIIKGKYGSEINSKDRLKTWIKHHHAVIAISRMLKDLTALNVFITFTNCTFSFCFLGYMMIKIPLSFFEKCVILMFGGGSLIQLYMLCYCVQELLDSSISVTTKAFHGEWFMRCQSTKNIFKTIIIADKIQSRLSAFGIVDLSLATFTQIINHAYSGCLVLQKAA